MSIASGAVQSIPHHISNKCMELILVSIFCYLSVNTACHQLPLYLFHLTVLYTDALGPWLESQLSSLAPTAKVHVLDGVNSDSGLRPQPFSFPGDDAYRGRYDSTALYPACSMARATKSAAELEVLRYVAWVSGNAHVEVMRTAAPGMAEYQMEARFL